MSAPQGARFHRGDAHRKRGQWRRDLVQLHDFAQRGYAGIRQAFVGVWGVLRRG